MIHFWSLAFSLFLLSGILSAQIPNFKDDPTTQLIAESSPINFESIGDKYSGKTVFLADFHKNYNYFHFYLKLFKNFVPSHENKQVCIFMEIPKKLPIPRAGKSMKDKKAYILKGIVEMLDSETKFNQVPKSRYNQLFNELREISKRDLGLRSQFTALALAHDIFQIADDKKFNLIYIDDTNSFANILKPSQIIARNKNMAERINANDKCITKFIITGAFHLLLRTEDRKEWPSLPDLVDAPETHHMISFISYGLFNKDYYGVTLPSTKVPEHTGLINQLIQTHQSLLTKKEQSVTPQTLPSFSYEHTEKLSFFNTVFDQISSHDISEFIVLPHLNKTEDDLIDYNPFRN